MIDHPDVAGVMMTMTTTMTMIGAAIETMIRGRIGRLTVVGMIGIKITTMMMIDGMMMIRAKIGTGQMMTLMTRDGRMMIRIEIDIAVERTNIEIDTMTEIGTDLTITTGF